MNVSQYLLKEIQKHKNRKVKSFSKIQKQQQHFFFVFCWFLVCELVSLFIQRPIPCVDISFRNAQHSAHTHPALSCNKQTFFLFFFQFNKHKKFSFSKKINEIFYNFLLQFKKKIKTKKVS